MKLEYDLKWNNIYIPKGWTQKIFDKACSPWVLYIVDHQAEDYKIDNSWFFPKLTTLRSKNNDWLVQSLQVDMSLHQGTLSWFQAKQSLLILLNVVC
jgi:hypothetical protein